MLDKKLNKIHILRDDDLEMFAILFEDKCLHEGRQKEFPELDRLPDLLRGIGFSVTEEGYDWEPSAV